MSETPKDNLIVEQFDFDILTASIKMIFSKNDFNINNFGYSITKGLHELEVNMWRRDLGKTEIFDKTYVPKTWKDHFKKKHRYKWWMRWWVKRKPIRHLKIERITVFPDVKTPNMKEFHDKYTWTEAVEE